MAQSRRVNEMGVVLMNGLILVLYFHVLNEVLFDYKQVVVAKPAFVDFWHQLKFKDHGLDDFCVQFNFSINQHMGTVERSSSIMILLDMLLETEVVREQVFGTATLDQLQFI